MAISTITAHNLQTAFLSLPIYQYAFFRPEARLFHEELRMYCRRSCRHYKTSWSCPPAIDSIEACVKQCLSCPDGLFFSSIRTDLPRNLSGKPGSQLPIATSHEQLTGRVEDILARNGLVCHTLTGDVCGVCQHCSYPKEPCKFPDLMHPCIESHGINVSELALHCGMDYYLDADSALQFSVIFFRPADESGH